ncbi:hypothetical protein [Flectobacillus major]|jgi:hypothetical protein|uniref:hypothetical protein n=1 Tax=Flectobacillus major TaxID=103 RepID=UPI000413DD50|nr:hypothetical protein [Flectobacillus major]
MKKLGITLLLSVVSVATSFAQCAMCRSVVESTISDGRSQIASNLNTGILYLLSAPYILAMVVGFLWWQNSKKGLSPQDIMRQKLKQAFK